MKRALSFSYPAAAFVLAATLYAHTAGFGFVWDDTMVINAARTPVSTRGIAKMFTESVDRLYRPVRTLSYAVENSTNSDSRLYHVSNILLYACSCALFYYVVLSLSGSAPISAAAAILFAAHPIHVEVVSSIGNGRADLLCSLFSFSSLIAFMSARRGSIALSAVLFALAILSKETAVVLPAAIFLIAMFRNIENSDTNASKRILQACMVVAPFVAITLLYVATRGAVLGRSSQATSWHGGDFVSTMLTSLSVVPDYAYSLFIPINQCALFVVKPIHSIGFDSIAGLAILAGGAAVSALLISKNFLLSFSIAFTLLTWIPASNIIPIAAIKALRFMYFPSVGACIIVAYAIFKVCSISSVPPRISFAFMMVLTCIIASIWGYSAMRESASWRDAATFWRHSTVCAPESAIAWNNLANTLFIEGKAPDAEAAFNKAIRLNPKFPQPYDNLAALYGTSGRYEEAISTLLKRKSIGSSTETDCKLAFAYRKVGNIKASEKSSEDCRRGIAEDAK